MEIFLHFKLNPKPTNQNNNNKPPNFLAVQSHIGTWKKMSLLEIRGSRKSEVVCALNKPKPQSASLKHLQ